MDSTLHEQDFDVAGDEIKFYPSTHTWTKGDKDATLSGAGPEHRFVLRIDGELSFQRGVINLIVGPTASGKTSILMALLGESRLNY